MKGSIIKPEQPIYNSRLINNYIKLIEKKYRHVNIAELLDYAQMEPYEVADQGHWFTQSQINLFQQKLIQLTENLNIAREAGRHAASPEALGAIRPYLLGMLKPSTAYELISNFTQHLSKSTTFRTKKVSANKIEINVTPKTGIKEKPFQCESRIGYFEAIAMLFQNELPEIEHPECVFKGGTSCRYIVTWKESPSLKCRKRGAKATIALSLISILVGVYDPSLALNIFLPATLIICLFFVLYSNHLEKYEFKSTLNGLKSSTDQLVEQININYNNATLTNEIGQTINKHKSIGDICSNFVQIFKKRLDYDRCLILLADSEKRQLGFRAGYGYTFNQLKVLKDIAFHLDKPDSKGIFVVSFKNQKAYLINDINEIKGELSSKSLEFAKKLGGQSFICCPIVSDGESIGIIAVDNLKSKKPLLESDKSFIMGIASILGVSIKNAILYEAKDKQFKSFIRTLAATIDARDPLTSGHSEKVTEYAVGICDELGVDDEFKEVIRVSALLHDYGKIGVPDYILKKRGRLTKDEYGIVKNHAEKTKRILEQISFEGMYRQVPQIAGAHHERYDGYGYPDGVKEEEIPLGARIIAAADFFEAITSRRPYREPMRYKKAIELMVKESGKKLDPLIVDAFIQYLIRNQATDPTYRATILETLKDIGNNGQYKSMNSSQKF